MVKLRTIILLLLIAAGMHGQVMTLHDCMAFAISNSTKIRIRQAAIDDARIARRDAALALFTPSISAESGCSALLKSGE